MVQLAVRYCQNEECDYKMAAEPANPVKAKGSKDKASV